MRQVPHTRNPALERRVRELKEVCDDHTRPDEEAEIAAWCRQCDCRSDCKGSRPLQEASIVTQTTDEINPVFSLEEAGGRLFLSSAASRLTKVFASTMKLSMCIFEAWQGLQ
jgi:hypothetical protein